MSAAHVARATRVRLGLTEREYRVLARLDTPRRIAAYLDRLPANFEPDGPSCLAVRGVLRHRRALCIEGALLAACALWVHGEPPLVMDLHAEDVDYDHTLALYRRGGLWGALSKTNHVWLRHRDPVYRSLRELAMSYFHEYCDRRGRRTMRSWSRAFDLREFDPALWVANDGHCWKVEERLSAIRHYRLFPRTTDRLLSRRDRLERRANELVWHPRPPAQRGPRGMD
jgi:hypothetical protein